MKYIGCDFHPSFQQIAMLDMETGEMVERRLGHENGEAKAFYESLTGPVVVGIEASGNTHWFEGLLARLGQELWMGDATKIREQDSRKQKHDRRDARLILKLMEEKRFPKVWIPSVEERDLRQLLIHRQHVVRMRSRVKNQLQHIALNQGLQRGKKLWSKAGMELLRQLELAPWTQHRRDTLLEMLEELTIKIQPLDQAVEREAEARPAAQLLQTHPGVGPVIFFSHSADHGRGAAVCQLAQLGQLPGLESGGGFQRQEKAAGSNQQAREPIFTISPGGRRCQRRPRRQRLGPDVCPTEGQEAPRRGQSSSGPQAGGAVVLDGAHTAAVSRGRSHAGEPESSRGRSDGRAFE